MNEDIMSIANALVYNYRLRCGTEKVAASRLKLDLSLLPPLETVCPKKKKKEDINIILRILPPFSLRLEPVTGSVKF